MRQDISRALLIATGTKQASMRAMLGSAAKAVTKHGPKLVSRPQVSPNLQFTPAPRPSAGFGVRQTTVPSRGLDTTRVFSPGRTAATTAAVVGTAAAAKKPVQNAVQNAAYAVGDTVGYTDPHDRISDPVKQFDEYSQRAKAQRAAWLQKIDAAADSGDLDGAAAYRKQLQTGDFGNSGSGLFAGKNQKQLDAAMSKARAAAEREHQNTVTGAQSAYDTATGPSQQQLQMYQDLSKRPGISDAERIAYRGRIAAYAAKMDAQKKRRNSAISTSRDKLLAAGIPMTSPGQPQRSSAVQRAIDYYGLSPDEYGNSY